MLHTEIYVSELKLDVLKLLLSDSYKNFSSIASKLRPENRDLLSKVTMTAYRTLHGSCGSGLPTRMSYCSIAAETISVVAQCEHFCSTLPTVPTRPLYLYTLLGKQ